MIEFYVYGQPKPGGSKRAIYNKNAGRSFIIDACKDNKVWREKVIGACLEQMPKQRVHRPMPGPLLVKVTFYMKRPRGHYGTGRNAGILNPSAPAYCTKRPDTTKLWRSTKAAVRQGRTGNEKDDVPAANLRT